MSSRQFLLDVDNTLLDNDRFLADLAARLEEKFGASESARYWAILAELREELGYVDYLASLQKFRLNIEDHPGLLGMSEFLLEYPFAERLYPHSLDVIAHLHEQAGTPVVLSDGDIVFQPRKIQHAGIWQAVDGRVLIYVHKERMQDAVRRHFPASHYIMVDDKPHLLAAMKSAWGAELTTVFVRQGHYAAEADASSIWPPPDHTIGRIGELLQCEL